jgi:hypothetical protein
LLTGKAERGQGPNDHKQEVFVGAVYFQEESPAEETLRLN